jgi:hypothetical protein
MKKRDLHIEVLTTYEAAVFVQGHRLNGMMPARSAAFDPSPT